MKDRIGPGSNLVAIERIQGRRLLVLTNHAVAQIDLRDYLRIKVTIWEVVLQRFLFLSKMASLLKLCYRDN